MTQLVVLRLEGDLSTGVEVYLEIGLDDLLKQKNLIAMLGNPSYIALTPSASTLEQLVLGGWHEV